jgi:ABC-type dipeptide/oligopeptide/nickel transport system permease subunit
MQKRKIVHRRSRKSQLIGIWKRYYEVKHGLVGLAIVIVFVLMALSAPTLFPQYPGELARVGPNYAAPDWTRFTDPNAPPLKNYLLDSTFKDDSAWNFSSTNYYTGLPDDHGSFMYDSSDFTSGNRSVKLSLRDNSTTSYFPTNVRGTSSFDYDYSTPTWVTINYQMKSNITGDLNPNSVIPYIRLHVPPDNDLGPIAETLARIDTRPRYPTEWRGYSRNITFLAFYYVFTRNTTVTFEFGLEYSKINVNATETGNVDFWFDNIEIFCFPSFWGPLGTTDKGQDVMAQLFWGCQVSLYVGIIATVIGVIVGLVVGLTAGYFPGIIDEILMRIVDFFLIIPTLPIMMVLAAVLSPSLEVTTMIIAIFAWPGPSRVIRSQVLVEKEKAYVEAAKAAGAGDVYVIFKHVFPNVLTLVFVQLATGVSGAILSESGLSFLGLTPQNLVSWGHMLQASYATGALMNGAWWFVIPPGLMIVLLSMGFVFIGYAVDIAMNPRQRKL